MEYRIIRYLKGKRVGQERVEVQPFRVVTERARECFEMSTCDRVEVLDVDNQVVFR
jgi:hypothetical protein